MVIAGLLVTFCGGLTVITLLLTATESRPASAVMSATAILAVTEVPPGWKESVDGTTLVAPSTHDGLISWASLRPCARSATR